MTITCVLVCEGTSDVCLQRFVSELLYPDIGFDFKPGFGSMLRNPAKSNLKGKIEHADRLFSPQLLLVHRDADKVGAAKRIEEIRGACSTCVPVVPVKQLEAWLLADREAILRMTELSEIPRDANYPQDIEAVSAKHRLKEVILECRLKSGWRRKDFNFEDDRAELGRAVSDLNRLRKLKSFRDFEEALKDAINSLLA